uniref:Ovule protein n=1 Tax=Ascaris lumbricoides TaxID=6252 RepID=A0A0M3HRE9_ASCLU
MREKQVTSFRNIWETSVFSFDEWKEKTTNVAQYYLASSKKRPFGQTSYCQKRRFCAFRVTYFNGQDLEQNLRPTSTTIGSQALSSASYQTTSYDEEHDNY